MYNQVSIFPVNSWSNRESSITLNHIFVLQRLLEHVSSLSLCRGVASSCKDKTQTAYINNILKEKKTVLVAQSLSQ